MNGTGTVKARDFLLGLYDRTSENELINVINNCELDKIPYLTDEYIKDKSETMLDYCRNNHSLFIDFHSDISGDIEIVNNALVKCKTR
jgi:hypothetical protein